VRVRVRACMCVGGVRVFTHVHVYSSNFVAACDLISFQWFQMFPSYISLSQMIFSVWYIYIYIHTYFVLFLAIIFIWKVNIMCGFDLSSWYLNGILFTLYKYTVLAHVIR
jgi:hypothetical protein